MYANSNTITVCVSFCSADLKGAFQNRGILYIQLPFGDKRSNVLFLLGVTTTLYYYKLLQFPDIKITSKKKVFSLLKEKIVPLDIEITKKILSEFGNDSSMIKYVKDRKGHDFRYAIDADKIESELGWKAEENFESGIKKTIEWYLKEF